MIYLCFRKNPGPGRGNFELHYVRIDRNNNLFQTAKCLERGDRVYLEGCLDYGTYKMTDTDKEHITSFIRPSVMVKFKKSVRKEQVEKMSEENV